MFLEKNLSVLQRRYPALAQGIRTSTPTGRYTLQTSARSDKLLNVVDRKANRLVYNNIDPFAGVENEIRSKEIRLPDMVVFLGFGLGYHLISYLNTYSSSLQAVMIFESDLEILHIAFTHYDFTKALADHRITLYSGSQPINYYTPLYNTINAGNNKLYAQAINFVDVPTSLSVDKDYYLTCIKVLKDAVTGVLTLYGNDPKDSLIGIQHTFYNINEIIDNPGIKDLEGAFKGKPGIVVSTGPSLLKNMHLLKGISDKVVIAAADASLKIMRDHGVKPHLVASLERVIETSLLFDTITPEDVKDVFFAGCPVVHPDTYKNFPGEHIIVYRHFATFKWLNIDKGILDIGPSSGNMSFKLLEYLGCNPIILIGQDLAYGADDLTHAKGGKYGDKQELYAKFKDIFVKGNYQPEIKTNQIWYTFLKHYEKDVAQSKAKVINATEGGAFINGTTVMTLQEAIDQYIKKDINVTPTIRKKLNKPFTAQIEKDRLSVSKKVEDAIKYCDYVIERLSSGVNICEDYTNIVLAKYRRGDPTAEAESEKFYDNVQGILSLFSEDKFYLIMMHYVQSYLIKSIIDINGIRATQPANVETRGLLMSKYADLYSVMAGLTHTMKNEFIILQQLLKEKGH